MADSVEKNPNTLPLSDRILAFGGIPALTLLTGWLLVKAGSGATGSDLFFSLWFAAIAGLLLIFCATLITWRITAIHHDNAAAVRENGLDRRAKYFEEMLHLIADNIPNVVFISDRDGRIWFANQEAVRPSTKDVQDVIGKTLDRIFPTRAADILLSRIRKAQEAGAPVVTMDRKDDAAGPHYLETYHIPLPNTSDLHHTVLVTQKDITSTIIERERQEQIFRQIVDVLIAVIDRRDPYAAGHSIRVGTIAANLAQHMRLDDPSVEACRVAGSLMNLGKIMVPRNVLVKTTALDEEELKLVRKAILASGDILSLISFQIPVIQTLRQVLERYDGTGVPEGRRGENIEITARIVALSNAFIALVSPRAHRPGLSVDDAFAALQRDAGTAYDPQLVKKLIEHLQQNPEMQEALMKPTPEVKGVVADKIR